MRSSGGGHLGMISTARAGEVVTPPLYELHTFDPGTPRECVTANGIWVDGGRIH
jgi:hypothetical protein